MRGKRLIADQFVFQVGELGPENGVKTARGGPPIEIEDLDLDWNTVIEDGRDEWLRNLSGGLLG